jgi:hypothetical protein
MPRSRLGRIRPAKEQNGRHRYSRPFFCDLIKEDGAAKRLGETLIRSRSSDATQKAQIQTGTMSAERALGDPDDG